MYTAVKVFKGQINQIEAMINSWAYEEQAMILNTSMCYDTPMATGQVFVIVVYQRNPPQPQQPQQ